LEGLKIAAWFFFFFSSFYLSPWFISFALCLATMFLISLFLFWFLSPSLWGISHFFTNRCVAIPKEKLALCLISLHITLPMGSVQWGQKTLNHLISSHVCLVSSLPSFFSFLVGPPKVFSPPPCRHGDFLFHLTPRPPFPFL